MTRIARLLAALLVVLLATGGCVTLPSSGQIRNEPAGERPEDETPVDFTPGGPEPGATPVEIVRGFLIAMRATPLNTSVARRFLTGQSKSSWRPQEGTVVSSTQVVTVSGRDVRLDLTDTVRLDNRGAWVGRRGNTSYDLDVVREEGEWRIDAPPNRLIIPTTHFETRFQQYFLYFFDRAAQVLVPEPVYVPTGAQATTFLVDGLLAGPERGLLGVERSYLPAGTRLDDISVPVTPDGTAQVPLSDEVLDLDRNQLGRVFAQLAWTLRQVSGIQRMRVTVDGSPLELPGQPPDVAVDAWPEYDPTISWATESLYGIRDDRVITLVGGEERRVVGPFGSLDQGVRRIAVDLRGERIAATTPDGRVLLSPRSRPSGAAPVDGAVVEVYDDGTELLSPAFDLHGTLWLVDRTPDGAELYLVRNGFAREVNATGISGADVRSFALSRDGSRLMAEVDRRNRDVLLQSRVERDDTGRVRGFTEAEKLPLPDLGDEPIRDIAWRSPGSLAVVTEPSDASAQVLMVKVDGSSTLSDASADAELFGRRAVGLVTSPAQGSSIYLRTPEGALYALGSNGRWTGSGIEPGLRSPTFVG